MVTEDIGRLGGDPTPTAAPKATLRFATTARALGFPPPPCAVRLSVLPRGKGILLLVWSRDGRAHEMVAWLEAFRPQEMRYPTPGQPRVLSASFDDVPAAWAAWLKPFRVRELLLDPSGGATLTIEGRRRELERFVERNSSGEVRALRETPALGPETNGDRLLTPRQREAVQLALREGYYALPRRTDLRALARRMGISSAALSELLRRAEGRIITDYEASNWGEVGKGQGPAPVGPDARAMEDEASKRGRRRAARAAGPQKEG